MSHAEQIPMQRLSAAAKLQVPERRGGFLDLLRNGISLVIRSSRPSSKGWKTRTQMTSKALDPADGFIYLAQLMQNGQGKCCANQPLSRNRDGVSKFVDLEIR
jgi:hypothetical protein